MSTTATDETTTTGANLDGSRSRTGKLTTVGSARVGIVAFEEDMAQQRLSSSAVLDPTRSKAAATPEEIRKAASDRTTAAKAASSASTATTPTASTLSEDDDVASPAPAPRSRPNSAAVTRFDPACDMNASGRSTSGGGGGGLDLDDTKHRIRGGGILASDKDLRIHPSEFAAGCNLLQAAAQGDVSSLSRLLSRHPSHVHFRDYDRRTALHVAASEGHLAAVEYLVHRHGAKLNVSDRWGGSPLDDAHRHRHADVARYLIARGGKAGDLLVSVGDRNAALISAAANGDLEQVKVLLPPPSPKPSRASFSQSSASAIAVARGASSAARALGGADKGAGVGGGGGDTSPSSLADADAERDNNDVVNAGDYDDRTALHLAAGEGHASVVAYLCDRGANVNAVDRWGGRPLDDARRRNFVDCERILLKRGALPGRPQSLIHQPSSALDCDVDQDEDAITSSSSVRRRQYTENNLRVDFEELEMIERIGKGEFGEIYKCRWRGILVAAKCIRASRIRSEWGGGDRGGPAAGDPASLTSSLEDGTTDVGDEISDEEKDLALADFRKETAILRALRHPNICMLLAYSTTKNFEVMISELMKCSLHDIFKANELHNTALPKKKQIVYAQQIAQGMMYLHTCKPPIVHRELTPNNILVDFSGTLKISDFGLPEIRRPLAQLRHDGAETMDDKAEGGGGGMEAFLMKGKTESYRYVAPEVFRNDVCTESVDVYSYAMVLYYLLSGKAPWPTLNGSAAAEKALEGERPDTPRDWNKRLAALLLKCWDPAVAERPTFQHILLELSEYSREVFKTSKNAVTMSEPDRGCSCVIS